MGIGCRTSTDNATQFGALELRTYGYEVLTCSDGGRCFRTAQTWLPYAAIVDIGLPDMTGYELARALRSLPDGSELLLIAVSGTATPTMWTRRDSLVLTGIFKSPRAHL